MPTCVEEAVVSSFTSKSCFQVQTRLCGVFSSVWIHSSFIFQAEDENQPPTRDRSVIITSQYKCKL